VWLARLRDCWQREQRTTSKVGDEYETGRGTDGGCGWGVIGTAGELMICEVEEMGVEELEVKEKEKEERGGKNAQ